MGIAVGTIIGAVYCALLGTDLSETFKSYFSQTSTILVTTFSAGIATFGVLLSIEHQSQLRQDEKNEKLVANRALLSSTLAEIANIAEHNARVVLAVARDKNRTQPSGKDPLSAYSTENIKPFISGEKFDVFRINIQLADINTQKWLTAISNLFQVAYARTNHLEFGPLRNKPLIMISSYDYAIDWVLIRNIAYHCLDYARGETTTISDRIERRLLNAELRPDNKLSGWEILEIVEMNSRCKDRTSTFLNNNAKQGTEQYKDFFTLTELQEAKILFP